MEQEDRIEIYTLPPNFAEEGTLLSGRVKTRNAIEAAALLLVLTPILLTLEIPAKAKLYLAMVILVPLVILGIIGVQGESLFAFVGSFFRYLRKRRYLAEPDERYRLERNRRRGKIRKGGGRHGAGKGRAKKEKPGMETGTEEGKTGAETGAEMLSETEGHRQQA